MTAATDPRIAAVRRFNRFYTHRIGVLRPHPYGARWSLAEARILYEIGTAADAPSAGELARRLGIDPGYVSRILRGFSDAGLLRRTASERDARRLDLVLTVTGRKAYAALDRASYDDTAALLAPLDDPQKQRLLGALGTVEALLGGASVPSTFVLRGHRAGDLGWVISRHGAIYAREYGWDASFEALVAQIAARFLSRHDERRERCWIAERDGVNVGSVLVVRKTSSVAQLRLLLVEPSARGMGIGRRLVAESIAFARAARYRRIMLWTNRGLDAARHLYDAAGFRLTGEEAHRSFGKGLVGQTFALDL